MFMKLKTSSQHVHVLVIQVKTKLADLIVRVVTEHAERATLEKD